MKKMAQSKLTKPTSEAEEEEEEDGHSCLAGILPKDPLRDPHAKDLLHQSAGEEQAAHCHPCSSGSVALPAKMWCLSWSKS